MTATILIVEDEEDILELLEYILSKEGYKVASVDSGEQCLSAVKRERPDLIILDLMLPGRSGLDICKDLKSSAEYKEIPVVILTARGDETDIVLGLELGADDYITKPFSPKVLAARLRTVLRRRSVPAKDDPQLIEKDQLRIDVARHEVTLAGELLDLTATEFKLLRFLVQNEGKVFTRLQIVHAVHGTDYPVTDRSVDVQIVGLRKKLGDFGARIDTVRGVGYRFTEGE